MALREEGFWDQHYGEELKNFEDAGDEGEVWFGRGLSRRIANYILNTIKSDAIQQANIIDIGCGNAFLLSTLAQKIESELDESLLDRFSCLGIDYSANSIELSRKILEAKQLKVKIDLAQSDFLNLEQVHATTRNSKYEIIVDVGTYDAICLLASDKPDQLESTKIAYMNSIYSLVKEQTIFIFASCNNTKEELLSTLDLKCAMNQPRINVIGEIETPKLQFGGREGSQVCCLIIRFVQ